MSQSLTRKWSTPSLSNPQSDLSGISSPRRESRRYQQILEAADIYMGQPKLHLRVTDVDKALCRKLLSTEQSAPGDSV